MALHLPRFRSRSGSDSDSGSGSVALPLQRRSRLRALGAAGVALALTATTAFAVFVFGPTTNEGSIGTVVTINGDSDFGTKKPKVWLVPSAEVGKGTKKYVMKVTEFSEAQITAEVKKGVAGLFDVVVEPKGAVPITYVRSYNLVAPQLGGLSTDTADPLDEVTITGTNFGTKKGKVSLGAGVSKGDPGKSKVTAWTDTSITFLASKKLPNGLYSVNVTNKLGTSTLANALTITNSLVGVKAVGKGTSYSAKLGGTGFSANVKASIVGTYNENLKSLVLFGLYQKITIGSGTIRTLRVSVPVDLDNVTFPFTTNTFEAEWSNNTFSGLTPGTPKVWNTDSGISVTINNYAGGRADVTFSGSVSPALGGATGTLDVTNGHFVGDVIR